MASRSRARQHPGIRWLADFPPVARAQQSATPPRHREACLAPENRRNPTGYGPKNEWAVAPVGVDKGGDTRSRKGAVDGASPQQDATIAARLAELKAGTTNTARRDQATQYDSCEGVYRIRDTSLLGA